MAGPPFVLIDRDGTLVVDVAFLDDPAGLEVLPTVVEGLQRLAAAGCELAVVTNQAGVARGLVTVPQLLAVNDELRRMLLQASGVDVGVVWWCPHHPDFTGPCRCRKPAPGMLIDANAGRERSWMIGDRDTDAEAAEAAGMQAVLVGERSFADAVEVILGTTTDG